MEPTPAQASLAPGTPMESPSAAPVIYRGRLYSYRIRMTSEATDEWLIVQDRPYKITGRNFHGVIQGAHPPLGRQALSETVHRLHDTWFPPGPHGYRTFTRDGRYDPNDESCITQLSNGERISAHHIVIETDARTKSVSHNYVTTAWFYCWDHTAPSADRNTLARSANVTMEHSTPVFVCQDTIVISWKYGEGNRIRYQTIADGTSPEGRHWSVARPTQTISIRDWTEIECEYLRPTGSEVPSAWFEARHDEIATSGPAYARPGCFPRTRPDPESTGRVLIHQFVDDQVFVPAVQTYEAVVDTENA